MVMSFFAYEIFSTGNIFAKTIYNLLY